MKPNVTFTEAHVSHFPKCDICGAEAHYDAKSIHGPWGYFCHLHFMTETPGKLGVGLGQRLVLTKQEK